MNKKLKHILIITISFILILVGVFCILNDIYEINAFLTLIIMSTLFFIQNIIDLVKGN